MTREHGTYACYLYGPDGVWPDFSGGCRCEGCVATYYHARRMRRRRHNDGVPPRVDPAPAIAHIAALLDGGGSLRSISAASGVNYTTVRDLRAGRYVTANRRTAEAILAVTQIEAADGRRSPPPVRLPDAPWADVERWLAAHTGATPTHRFSTSEREYRLTISDRDTAELLGVSRRSIARWRAQGFVPGATLEAIADRLRVHPSELWPGYVDALIESTGTAA